MGAYAVKQSQPVFISKIILIIYTFPKVTIVKSL